ncbi:MAG: hypothetical protein HY521_03815 [Proteobacteria bacterium]|nr:hypothetical protein [Pseudomonadota bacterium]
MTSVTPPLAIPQPPTAAQQPVTLALAEASKAVRALAVGSLLSGEVAQVREGLVALRTPLGPVALAANLSVAVGAHLTLRIAAGGERGQVQLLALGDRPVVGLRGASLLVKGAVPTGAIATAAAATVGAGVRAAIAPLAPGTTLAATLVRAPPTAPGAAAPAPASAPGGLGAVLAAGAPLSVRVLAVTPTGAAGAATPTPGAPALQPGPGPAGAVVAATVVAAAGGQTLVQSPIGWLSLATPATLPLGTSLSLEITAGAVASHGPAEQGASGPAGAAQTAAAGATPAAPGASPPPAVATGLSGPGLSVAAQSTLQQVPAAGTPGAEAAAERPAPAAPAGAATAAEESAQVPRPWPSLTEAVRLLAAAEPMAYRQLLQALPQPGPQLTANVLFFLVALRGGDVRAWLGEGPLRALERAGRGDLVARLGEEFRRGGRGLGEPAAGEWRSVGLPFFTGAAVEEVRLHLRRHGEEADEEGGRGGGAETRFVIDLDLSRLGRMQLDGFVRKATRRFDLIVRTRAALPVAMRGEINRIFSESCAATGLAGEIGFQATARFVEVEPAPPARHEGILA